MYKPIEVSNAINVERPELGDMAPVALYRLIRLVVFEDLLGRGAAASGYLSGKKLGKAMGFKKIDSFLSFCNDLKIGLIDIPRISKEEIHVDVRECVTCSGLTPVGRPLCSFEAGLIAGSLESITGKTVKAKEVTCIGGLGDETCGFDLTLS